MDDLHQRLSMRRKGISGDKETSSPTQKTNVMNRISAMIPAPPPVGPKDTSSDASDEDDWN